MSAIIVFCAIVIVLTVFKFLNVSSPKTAPRIVCGDDKFTQLVRKYCPHLDKP